MIYKTGAYERVSQKVKKRQIRWFCHMSRHDILTNTILQDRVEFTKKRGHPKRNCMDDVYEWTGMSTLYLINVTKDSHN